ncbi:biotin--[acetyl-CoA-carboxylase] ligase [Sulfurimonas sp.]|uniref:biotin--[acetyl-CoA-carboxylase] ligase n=1 Tax=Sulfurimonas sp. TaxID=2022749 RepID=UPI0025E0D03F|nr:biotin--[acetyl-CoA-carboxylase] ligase [Sulfurimonas sp.]MDD5156526.1 biotin--[acetyl-CoA-carboxylase] ligase [Sulfurimonas sp.]
MQILYLKSIDSTQKQLKELIESGKVSSPIAVVSQSQTAGYGSRGNSWESLDENLFLSFALPIVALPKDLKLESASIYFSHILKETLNDLGSKVWIKWPNDFYIDDKKVGGIITNILDDKFVCGIGINTNKSPEDFGKLDIEIDKKSFIEIYLHNVEKYISWKQVFSKYKLEFYRNQNFFTHRNSLRFSLERAILQDDGSIIVDGERIYSLR